MFDLVDSDLVSEKATPVLRFVRDRVQPVLEFGADEHWQDCWRKHGLVGAVASYLRALGWVATEREVSTVISCDTAPNPQVITVDLSATWGRVIDQVAEGLGDCSSVAIVAHQPGLTVRMTSADIAVVVGEDGLWDVDRCQAFGHYLQLAAACLLDEFGSAQSSADGSALGVDTDAELLEQLGRGADREIPSGGVVHRILAFADDEPNRPALAHRDTEVTYAELRDWVRCCDRWLTERGVKVGDVVGVAVPRGIPWAATVIAILGRGAIYLPLSADDPPARFADLRDRAGARLVVDEVAIRELTGRVLEGNCGDGLSTADDTAFVARGDEPAYVYYTSGSTGLPKGALCGHGGMMNHLWAKVDDLGLSAADRILQSAQATFDISLWQLLAPLMIGAHCTILDQEQVLDIRGSLTVLRAQSISVMQVVPSYLAVLLDHLERHEVDLSALRLVSVTGEAISIELAQRFFGALTGRILVNAYGATEACDDTTHEIMVEPPEPPSVPVGRPVGNVTVRVVDQFDRPVPPGSPGEIVFSGVCVGLGYLDDPQRTEMSFGVDPVRPSMRMYRSGDFGRWLGTGTLQFHGRRDEQVKVSGIRLELGEVESALRQVDGVTDAAVVAVRSDGSYQLAGFYAAVTVLNADTVKDAMRCTLPLAAVPTLLVQIEALPLTGNGKVDKLALRRRVEHLTAERQSGLDSVANGSTEFIDQLKSAWALALNIPVARIDDDSDFFELGGTSLRALRAVAAVSQWISISDLFQNTVFRDLVAKVRQPVTGESNLLHRVAGVPDANRHVVFVPDVAQSALAATGLADLADLSAAVWGVQLPTDGTDSFDRIARQLRDQILELPGRALVVGHGIGVVLAHAATLGTEAATAMFGSPPADPQQLHRQLAILQALDSPAIARRVRPIQAKELTETEVGQLGATIRRQQVAAFGHLLEVLNKDGCWPHSDIAHGDPADELELLRQRAAGVWDEQND